MKGVILHLLYNRGTSPRRIEGGITTKPDVEAERRLGERVNRTQLRSLTRDIDLVTEAAALHPACWDGAGPFR